MSAQPSSSSPGSKPRQAVSNVASHLLSLSLEPDQAELQSLTCKEKWLWDCSGDTQAMSEPG